VPYTLAVLADAPFIAFIPVTDVVEARSFYEGTLGLPVVEEGPFALVVDANGTDIRITPVPSFTPQPFTIAGWDVEDVDAVIAVLVSRGVVFNRYEGMEQRENGAWESPNGDLVAWFTDPFGNTLSLTSFLPS
jgi:catechol 2,3-dioxygenase-like lactoylglutathione lyase family enzyme